MKNVCYVINNVKNTNTHQQKISSFSEKKIERNRFFIKVGIWNDSQESNLFFHFALRSHNRVRRIIVISRDVICSKFNKDVASGGEIKYCNNKKGLVRINSILTFVKRGPPDGVNNDSKSFRGYVRSRLLSENISIPFYSNNIKSIFCSFFTRQTISLQVIKKRNLENLEILLVNDNECKKPGNHTYKLSSVFKERGRV